MAHAPPLFVGLAHTDCWTLLWSLRMRGAIPKYITKYLNPGAQKVLNAVQIRKMSLLQMAKTGLNAFCNIIEAGSAHNCGVMKRKPLSKSKI